MTLFSTFELMWPAILFARAGSRDLASGVRFLVINLLALTTYNVELNELLFL